MTQLAVLDKYGRRFGRQELREQKQVEIVTNPKVDRICQRYEKWLTKPVFDVCIDSTFQDAYSSTAYGVISGLRYTSKDVTDFCLALLKYQERKSFTSTGLFLSALVEKSKEEEFEIITEHLDVLIDYIGYKNSRNLVVKGNAGDGFGESCSSGKIILTGNAEHNLGWHMNGGSISVFGDVGALAGRSMVNGSIDVHGSSQNLVGSQMIGGEVKVCTDAGEEIGNDMEGGILRIDGKIKSISEDWKSGKIYHKGKLIRGKE